MFWQTFSTSKIELNLCNSGEKLLLKLDIDAVSLQARDSCVMKRLKNVLSGSLGQVDFLAG